MRKLWDNYTSWKEAEEAWDKQALQSAEKKPLKKLHVLPNMPGITPDAARFLKLKSLKYMFLHKEGKTILRHIFKRPIRYGLLYFKSLFKKKSYKRDEDFFLYGLSSVEDFSKEAMSDNALIVIGFSYCQKPFECPSGRFTDQCIHDPSHPVCSQCDIGKFIHALPAKKTIPLLIPTVHYIGDKMFEIAHANPDKKVLFLITACEMTLEMFGDFGNMLGIKGIGVRLDGRICNTMKAFVLSEEGIKPGLTVVTSKTRERLLDLIRNLRCA